jgi:hypothetical protein
VHHQKCTVRLLAVLFSPATADGPFFDRLPADKQLRPVQGNRFASAPNISGAGHVRAASRVVRWHIRQ